MARACAGCRCREAAAARLRRLLEQLDWSAMPAEGKLRGAWQDNSFKLGLSTKAWSKSNNGPYAPFAFKPVAWACGTPRPCGGATELGGRLRR